MGLTIFYIIISIFILNVGIFLVILSVPMIVIMDLNDVTMLWFFEFSLFIEVYSIDSSRAVGSFLKSRTSTGTF